jgi:hypothetical protein
MQQATFKLLSTRVSAMTDIDKQAEANSLLQEWNEVSQALLGAKAEDVAGAATDYLHYSAYTLLGVLWLDMASAASHSSNEIVANGKAKTCAFYIKRILPRKDVYKSVVLSASDDLMALADEEFDYI